MTSSSTRDNPAFYVSKENNPSFTYNYGWYTVFTMGKLSIIDRREGRFGSLYTSTADLTQKGGINSDKELYDLLADGLIIQLKSPFFAVWEIGEEKPFEERYFSMNYACKKAHAMAVSEPPKQVKEKTNV